MISPEILVPWIFFSNAILTLLLVLAIRRIGDRLIRYSFIAVLITTLIYINPLLAFFLPDLSSDARLLLSRFVFNGVILLANAFVVFTILFCRIVHEFRHARFYAFVLSNITLIVLVWTGFLPEGIHRNGNEFALTQGFAHTLFVASTGCYVLYLSYIALIGYRRSQDEVLRFQIRYVVGVGSLVAFALVITNSVIPYLIQRSILAPLAALEMTVFWAASLYILVEGELLVLKNDFSRLIRSRAFANQETLYGFRSYLSAFACAIDVDRPVEERLSLLTCDRRSVRLKVSTREGANGTDTGVVPIGWYESQFEELQKLRSENFRLSIAAEKSKQLGEIVQNRLALEESSTTGDDGSEVDAYGVPLTPLERAEKKTIAQHLEKNRFNQAQTSRELGIRPNTLIVKMRKYCISAPGGQRPGRKPALK